MAFQKLSFPLIITLCKSSCAPNVGRFSCTFLVFFLCLTIIIIILIVFIQPHFTHVIFLFSSLFAEYSISKKQKCGDRTFQCVSGKCIHANFVCDGENDCDDKSDEAPDLCSTKQGKYAIISFILPLIMCQAHHRVVYLSISCVNC